MMHSIEKGDAIIHEVGGVRFQWVYRTDEPRQNPNGFESGNFEPIVSHLFDTREEAITHLRQYTKGEGLILGKIF